MYIRGRKAQVTLFVIIAIILLSLVAIIAFSYPKIKPFISRTTPQVEIELCIQKAVADAVAKLGNAGFAPKIENTFSYQGNKIPYLCYTSENYKTCTAQVGILKTEAELAITEAIKPAVSACHAKARAASRNTQVEEKPFSLSIEPRNVEIKLNSIFTFTQGDTTQSITGLNVKTTSGAYDLLFIAQDIINLEARYGDAFSEAYLREFPHIKVQKLDQGEGSTIFILTDTATGEQMLFATRSRVFPPGYGYS